MGEAVPDVSLIPSQNFPQNISNSQFSFEDKLHSQTTLQVISPHSCKTNLSTKST